MSGPTSADEIDGLAAGPDASAYVTGRFRRWTTLAGRRLTSAGEADIPVARFDAEGNAIWVKHFGGPGDDNLFDADADRRGMVGTGWFSGTVDFGGVELTSAGKTDCIVLALRPDGTTRWAERFGGTGFDGCNEVTLSDDGTVTTSIDTQGGWAPDGHTDLPTTRGGDTVLMRLTPDGTPEWTSHVGGRGRQRGKAIAVAPDGSVSFGGDSRGSPTIAHHSPAMPDNSGGRTAWLARWGPDGSLQWATTWGGPGNEFTKGIHDDGVAVTVSGPFTESITVGKGSFDAGGAQDLVVAQWSASGLPRWATSVRAPGRVPGAEVIGASDDGVLLGITAMTDMQVGSTDGDPIRPDTVAHGTPLLVHYRSNGVPTFAKGVGSATHGNGGEIDRAGRRVYLDVVLTPRAHVDDAERPPGRGKDASIWALDLMP